MRQLLYKEGWLKMIRDGKMDWEVSPGTSKLLFNFDGNDLECSGRVSSAEKTSGDILFVKTNSEFSEIS